jgi:hypothetical protein
MKFSSVTGCTGASANSYHLDDYHLLGDDAVWLL